MGLLKSDCKLCGKATPNLELSMGVCPGCLEIMGIYDDYNAKLEEAIGKRFNLTAEEVVKLDKDEFKKSAEALLQEHATKCNTCKAPVPFKDLINGSICKRCHDIIYAVAELNEFFVNIGMNPPPIVIDDVVKQSDEKIEFLLRRIHK